MYLSTSQCDPLIRCAIAVDAYNARILIQKSRYTMNNSFVMYSKQAILLIKSITIGQSTYWFYMV